MNCNIKRSDYTRRCTTNYSTITTLSHVQFPHYRCDHLPHPSSSILIFSSLHSYSCHILPSSSLMSLYPLIIPLCFLVPHSSVPSLSHFHPAFIRLHLTASHFRLGLSLSDFILNNCVYVFLDGLADCMDPDCCLQPSCQNQLYCKGSPDPGEVLSQSPSSLAPQQVRSFDPVQSHIRNDKFNCHLPGMDLLYQRGVTGGSICLIPFLFPRLPDLSTSASTS